VPREILKKGKDAILSYLKDFYDDKMILNEQVKLILVGHEGVGKTTLVKALGGNISSVEKTDGIEVSEIKLTKKCTLRSFDFAGDVDFLESHSLFMTDDTNCLVVFDLNEFYTEGSPTSDSQLGRASLWLETIHVFAPHSRCLLVGTHADNDKLNPGMLNNIWHQFRELLHKARRCHTAYHEHSHLQNCLVCQSVCNLERESKYKGLAGYVEVTPQEIVESVESDSDSHSGLIVPHITGYYEVSGTTEFPNW
ncbi:putative serine/threonine-protein kinase roco11, partial [Saccoglossus kowalevskii]